MLLHIPWPQLAPIRPHTAIATAAPYPGEHDPNQSDRPRLDNLYTMHGGSWLWYHPGAEPISSCQVLPIRAMMFRYRRAAKLARQRARWGQ